MNLLEPIEITLDKPRKLLINHLTLFKAEADINKMRSAKPEDYAAIDSLMIDAFNHLYRARGMLPLDLMICLLTHGLVYEKGEKRLTIEEITALLDKTELSRAELSGIIWGAYFKVASKSLQAVDANSEEGKAEQKKSTGRQTGNTNGVSPESS